LKQLVLARMLPQLLSARPSLSRVRIDGLIHGENLSMSLP
jgi:hypothetical protein